MPLILKPLRVTELTKVLLYVQLCKREEIDAASHAVKVGRKGLVSMNNNVQFLQSLA